ncbi:hypothetical protein [Brevundimonas sp. Root1423]|uniref:hypothetical protein n=1 Tax=Brevundimonas sp. Root1423 TaxID=1736462 RepID=UPI00070063D5|nr:hypothetical protein [Brevundimonas sp. Root1423]KQY96563.1 hypothetical protein ASD25_01475 [Brevundimonas sp. Root1423]
MKTKRTFGQAIALWEATRQTVTDDDFATLENAERVILAHKPTSLADAASMLEVVMEQRGDGRSDGLDLRAIEHVVSLLRNGIVADRSAAQANGSIVVLRANQA